VIHALVPEMAALAGCPQEPDWHPEGDVWIHTLHCMDAFARERTADPWEELVVGLAVLCHDLGKPATTTFEGGRVRSRGHDVAGAAPTRTFLARLACQDDLIEQVVALVVHHLHPADLYKSGSKDAAVRRLARCVGRIDRLVRVARADRWGRPPLPFDGFPEGDWLLERARRLGVEAAKPRPLVLGRHLMELGLAPGPQFKPILSACYEAQIDGEFTTVEEGIAFARRWIRALGHRSTMQPGTEAKDPRRD
jgi:tRNA nucleotidyltransferase (CCA-adding enzyme)